MITAFLLLTAALLPAQAQNTQAVVVKQNGDKIYLDTSSLSDAVHTGDIFKIITKSEPLINPKTGKNLGEVYEYSAPGTITEVQPLYAIGEIKNAPAFPIGAQAVLQTAQEKAVQPAKKDAAGKNVSSRAVFTYEPIEQVIVGISEGNITTPNQIVTLSDKGQITVFSAQKDKLTLVLTAALPSGSKPIALSVADIKNTGSSQIFASFYNLSRKTIQTAVLENEAGALKTTDTLNFFVKEVGCAPQKTLWGQTPFVLGERPGNARKVIFDGQKWQLDKQDVNTRRQWLTNLNFYPYEKEQEGLVYISSNGAVRMQIGEERWASSKSLFASTPNRVKYKQEAVKFYPSLQIYTHENAPVVTAVQNTAKLGLLADLFGQYKEGKIHFLSLEKGRLVISDTVELDGYVYATACTQDAILTAEVLEDGFSSVKAIAK